MEIDTSNHRAFSTLTPQNEFQEEVLTFIQEWFSPSSTVKVQTSGSTGVPKIFEVEKEKMRQSARMTCDFLSLQKGDTALLCLPMAYISGKMMVVRALERGLKLKVETPTISPIKTNEGKIDFCAMTPLQVEHSLPQLPFIKKLIIGGAAVSEALIQKINQSYSAYQPSTTSCFVYETYGMSETLSHIALRQIYPPKDLYFKTLEGVKISSDSRGCLCIDAPSLNSEHLITNDLVDINTPRSFKFLGRVDNIINTGGAKVIPELLEALVKKEISREVLFLGLPDEVFGEKLIMVVEGERTREIEVLIDNFKFEKSFYKPKEVFYIPEIPRTPNGKVSRLDLKKYLLNITFNRNIV